MITSARDLADVVDAAFSVGHGLGNDGTSDRLHPASRQRAADLEPFVSIGRGSFGIVFALPRDVAACAPAEKSQEDDQERVGEVHERGKGIDVMVKRTILVGVDDNKWLENDAVWQEKIEKTFDDLRGIVELPYVPRLLRYLPKDAGATTIAPSNSKPLPSLNDWWESHCASKRRWTNVHGDADHEYQLRDQVLLAERIPAVPKGVRDGIIDRFAATSNPSPSAEYLKAIREHPSNDAALLRVYAGLDPEPRIEEPAQGGRPRRLKMFSLLNYPMNLPTMRELLGEEQVEKAVKMLGNALAVMHFGVGCDGRDVEFVSGAKPKESVKGGIGDGTEREKEDDDDGDEERFDRVYHNENEMEEKMAENVFTLFGEDVSMWLLDFNQVRALPSFPFSIYGRTSRPPSAEGLEPGAGQKQGHLYDKARQDQWLDLTVSAFFGNDPYYPRPDGDMQHTWSNREEAGLWGVFGEAYFDAVYDLVRKANTDENGWSLNEKVNRQETERVTDNTQLAMEFLGGVEEECKKRKEPREERERDKRKREREAAMQDWTSAQHC